MKINLKNTEEIIFEFFKNNSNVIYKISEDENNIPESFGITVDGILLGRFLKKDNVIINNTFVNQKGMFDDQIDIHKITIESLQTIIENLNLETDDLVFNELMKVSAENLLINLKNT